MQGYQAVPAVYPPQAAVAHGVFAPPASYYGSMPGYEGTVAGFGGGFLPPPVPFNPAPPPEPAAQPDWSIPPLSEDKARSALKSYVSEQCCYSSNPADSGIITNMEPFNTYRYRLETFTESRSTEWSEEPFVGQPIDAYGQPPPGPWEVPAQAPTMFKDHTQIIKVPNTSSVKDCNTCVGTGKTPCKDCSSSGNVPCSSCSGSGRTSDAQPCSSCESRGKKKCSHCDGKGMKNCETCKGKAKLLIFINLKVQWTNNNEDFLVEQDSGVKVEKLKNVSGKKLFEDSRYLVYPVMGFPLAAVSQASDRMVKEHQSKFSQSARILQQRQTIELIPITKVSYKWKEGVYSYLVYGTENKVSADDYPATCCCTIL